MFNILYRHRFLSSLILLFTLFISYPLWQDLLQPITIIVLLAAPIVTIILIAQKHWLSYAQGETSYAVFVRNIFLEIFGILLAMALAGLLGRYIAQIATEQITNNLIKFIAGILLGLLAGMGVGLLMKRAWGQLLKV